MDVKCYSQRLLNPFRGAVNCLRFESAEAVTLDGVTWDIYVANDALREGLETTGRVITSDIRYGRWSADAGLRRGPICPSDDFKRLEHMGAVVYEALLRLHDRVPFPFTDTVELWLLDAETRPLALLHCVTDTVDIEIDRAIEWRAGNACRESFVSTAITDIGDSCCGEYLTAYVNKCAGEVPRAQWFQRHADGSGTALNAIGERLPERQKRNRIKKDFPELLLDNINHDDAHRRLIADFFSWQAPWLLTLHTLNHDLRATFERQARACAQAVASQHRLYPRIIDDAAIQAARVEAMMRTNQAHIETAEDTLSVFYKEMGATGG